MPSVASLAETFLAVLDQAVTAGRSKPKTREFYFWQFKHFSRSKDLKGMLLADRDGEGLTPSDLAGAPYTFHFCRAVRRLFKWAHEAGHVSMNRFVSFNGPPCGQRERVLIDDEYDRIMQVAKSRAKLIKCQGSHPLRRILWVLRQTMARPGELRSLRWRQIDLTKRTIRLSDFKAKNRRRDGVKVRVIPLSSAVVYLLGWWKRTRNPSLDDHVFLNSKGRPWTANSLRLAMHSVAEAAGVNAADGERIVTYTFRHTAATEATRNGIEGRLLADIMGHSTTRMTERYQHLGEKDMVDAIDRATSPRRRGHCKDCLADRGKIVSLVDGVCPRCKTGRSPGADHGSSA